MTFNNTNIKLLPSEVSLGGLLAPSLRAFCFKVETEFPRFPNPRGLGCLLVSTDDLGIIFMSKSLGGFMSTEKQCDFCPVKDSPLDHLVTQYALITFSIEGTIQIIRSEESNLLNTYAYGLQIAWNQFNSALERYVTHKGDDFTLIAGGE